MNTVHIPPVTALKSIARACNALYICPKDADGKRRGPLVAYAGKSPDGKNLCGDIYFNFGWIEAWPTAVERFAEAIADKLVKGNLLREFDTVCGIPEGGRTLGQALARITDKRFVYVTKVPVPTDTGKKQEYRWDHSRFEIIPDERLLLCEDVTNNLQNTDNTLAQIGGRVVLLGTGLNRSPFADTAYVPKTGPYMGISLPIVAAWREPFPEYEQTDPPVAEDIAAGKLELQVKKNWRELMAIMDAPSPGT